MIGPHKTKVVTDIKKNRIYITLPTNANTKELEKIYSEIRFGIADLQPGFDVITDLTNCSIGHLNAIPIFWKITSYLTSHKVGRVVRIVGDMGLILKQLMAVSAKFQCYKPIYVLTMEEAEEELRYPIKPDGIRFQLHDRELSYQVDGEQVKGAIVDISTSGCAIRGQTNRISEGMPIPVAFELGKKGELLTPFSLQSKVVRVHDDMFAVQFTDMDDPTKRQLYDSLTCELNNNF